MKYQLLNLVSTFFLTEMRESCINCALRISMLAKYIEIPEFCYDMNNLIYFSKRTLVYVLYANGLFSFTLLYGHSVIALVLLLSINVTTCHATKFISHDAHFRCN